MKFSTYLTGLGLIAMTIGFVMPAPGQESFLLADADITVNNPSMGTSGSAGSHYPSAVNGSTVGPSGEGTGDTGLGASNTGSGAGANAGAGISGSGSAKKP